MEILSSLWLAVKILGCIYLIGLLVSMILSILVQDIQGVLLERAKRKSIESLTEVLSESNQDERKQYLSFLEKVATMQNKIVNSNPNDEKKE